MQAMEISRTALDVEWRRLEISAENLANMNSARIGTQPLYQAKTLVSGPRTFAAHLDHGVSGGESIDLQNLAGVAIYGIEASNLPPRLAHEPGSPQADANGMVAYPNIDHAAQMLLMVKTSRAYEANMVAMNLAREMYSKALDLGEAFMSPAAMTAIAPVDALPRLDRVNIAPIPVPTSPVSASTSFSQLLSGGIENVNANLLQADKMARAFALDDSIPVHQVTYALEQARLSLDLALQVRTRLIDGYQQLMNMQL